MNRYFKDGPIPVRFTQITSPKAKTHLWRNPSDNSFLARNMTLPPSVDNSVHDVKSNPSSLSNFRSSVTSNMQRYFSSSLGEGSDLMDPTMQIVSGLINGGIDIDNNQQRQKVTGAELDAGYLVQKKELDNSNLITQARNTATTTAQKPWEVTNARADYEARMLANSTENQKLSQMLSEFKNNQENLLSNRNTNQNFWGGLFGPFGRFGATLYDLVKHDQQEGNIEAFRKSLNDSFDPLASSGQHVKLSGSSLPDDLGTAVKVSSDNPPVDTTSDKVNSSEPTQ